VQLVFDGFAGFTVGARRERGERHDPELCSTNRLRRRCDDGLGDGRTGDLHGERDRATGAPFAHAQLDIGAGRSLDQGRGRIGGQAGERAPVDRHDQVARLEHRAGSRRGVEHTRDQQPPPQAEKPPVVGVNRDADAGEARRLVEFAIFLGREVVGEAVVEASDGARDRRVGERSLGDRAIVVAGNPADRFVDDPGRMVGYERAARERRQVFGVSAQPDAENQDDRQRHREYGDERSLTTGGHASAG
jgi:hypothetical protein